MLFHIAGPDPGLVVGGGANPWGGAPTQYIYTFSEKTMKFKKNWSAGGGGGAGSVPPKSATALFQACHHLKVNCFDTGTKTDNGHLCSVLFLCSHEC